MSNRIKMSPFVTYKDRGRVYGLLSVRLEMEHLYESELLGENQDKFKNTLFSMVKEMKSAFSVDTEKNAGIIEAIDNFSIDSKNIIELFENAFKPMTAEEIVILGSLKPNVPMSKVIVALKHLSTMVVSA